MPPRLDRPTRLLAAAVLVAVGIVSLRRGLDFAFDFHHFYRDAEYVWTHATLNPNLDEGPPESRRQLPFYLPSVSVLLAPLAAAGPRGAALLWTGLQVVSLATALAILLRTARRRTDAEDSDASAHPGPVQGSHGAQFALLLLGLPALIEAARFNQLSLPILALALAGVAALERGQAQRGGVLLGAAAAVKLLPALLLVWLVLRRSWTAAGTMVATIAAVSVVPVLAVLGPQETIQEFGVWWRYNVVGAASRGMTDAHLREHFIDHRNQSAPAVVARLTVPEQPYRAPWQPFALAPGQALGVARAVLLAWFAMLVWGTWRSLRRGRDEALWPQAAAFLVGMLVLSPLVRQYYLVWALPALRELLVAIESPSRRDRSLAWIGAAIWTAGMLLWPLDAARVYGAHLVMLAALGAVVLLLAQPSAARGAVRDDQAV